MVLVSNSEINLQKLVNKAKNFLNFPNIRLNPGKCEVLAINPNKNDE
jgi:hypothetical protein